jgi:hypothetical protein
MLYAAHVSRLVQKGLQSSRLDEVPADPNRAGQIARPPSAGRGSASVTVAFILDALRAWEGADPDNGLPHALESHYLHELHRDGEAQAAWQRAGGLPSARDYAWNMNIACARLLTRMGMVEADAAALTLGLRSRWAERSIRSAAGYAWYEGSVAQLEGRDAVAIAWWNSTISLGRHMQRSAETESGFRQGMIVEETGADPTWRMTGLRNPLYYGPAHGFYVARVGPAIDAQVRQKLVKTRARLALLSDTPGEPGSRDALIHATALQGIAGQAVAFAGCCLALFVLTSLVSRRTADAAARRGRVWPAAAAALVVCVALVGPTSSLVLHPPSPVLRGPRVRVNAESQPPAVASLGSAAAALALAITTPLLLALRKRESELELNTAAWRGNLRRLLPVTMAACALAYLGLSIASARLRSAWLAPWKRPGTTEFSARVGRLGPRWDDPPVPKQAWVAADPPEGSRPLLDLPGVPSQAVFRSEPGVELPRASRRLPLAPPAPAPRSRR